MSLAATDPRHGTNNGYNNLGCRCRAATREYQRALRTGGYRRVPCECGGVKRPEAARCRTCENTARAAAHGTESRYKGGCRCADCRAASAAARRRRRAAA